jgi:hypothetical protein
LHSTEINTFNQTVFVPPTLGQTGEITGLPEINAANTSFELGLWLLGLNSFLNTRNHSFVDGIQSKAVALEWTNEVRLTKFALFLVANLTSQIVFESQKETSEDDFFDGLESSKNLSTDLHFSSEELNNLALKLRNFSVLGEGLLRSAPINFQEWTAWSEVLANSLSQSKIVSDLMENAETISSNSLPVKFQQLIANKELPSDVAADLQSVLPYFNRIFKYLGIIEKMLEHDKPLKPSLLFFAAIYEESQEMLAFIKKRLLRFKNEENPMFEALDCAVFATSMEIRKVYQSELGEVSSIRQGPILCARIEAAFGLLRDCFQQTFVGFARFVEPEIDPINLFENFNVKLKQSIILRKELWQTLQVVKNVENSSDAIKIQELQDQLSNFLHGSMKYLMYKDLETVERFIEEVILTKNSSDLVPTLHRFGAYLETLFGQVKMRVVLMNHPFEY